MKPVFSTFLAASLALLTPQLAEACMVSKQLTQLDIAFADVIFEGSLTAVNEVPADKTAGGRKFFEFTFDVHDVVRGKLQQDEIVVGWIHPNYRNPLESSLETLKESIGETTRVAITTPELAGLFCELKLRYGHFYDEDTGTVVSGEHMQPTCDSTAGSLEPAVKENIPFVISNDYICGNSYLFPVQRYEDMRNYDKNYEAFKAAREKARKEARVNREKRETYLVELRERRQEMVPEGPLMWRVPHTPSRTLAVRLGRHYKLFFTPAFRDHTALQESVLDLGIAFARYDIPRGQRNRPAWFERDETSLAKFREDLKSEILRLLDYMEKDPNFRNRLLLED